MVRLRLQIATCLMLYLAFSSPLLKADFSLCVVGTTDCPVPSGLVRFAVRIGQGDSIITGGQFNISYNPTLLDLLQVAPGSTCDPMSPFVLEVYRDVNEGAGRLFYAAGIDFSRENTGTAGPSTLACLTFVVIGAPQDQGSVCLFDAPEPFSVLLGDDSGNSVPIDNSVDCPPNSPPPTIACDNLTVSASCACTSGAPDCSLFDTGCKRGVCNDTTARCEAEIINEGGACDDGDACTTVDRCANGICVGTGCPNPSLCIVTGDECNLSGGEMTARLLLGIGNANVVGGQFLIHYDPVNLRLLGFAPGRECDAQSPFVGGAITSLDELQGNLHCAITVDPAAMNPGSFGPATLVCLKFAILGPVASDLCVLPGVTPMETILVSESGYSVPIDNGKDCPTDVPGVISCDAACQAVPALSQWGLLVTTLLLLVTAKVHYGGGRRWRSLPQKG